MKKYIKKEAENIFGWLQDIRHHLHENPELSFEEYQTSAYVKAQLENMGFQDITMMGGTGVVLDIKGDKPGSKVLALRADMDALPIIETNEIQYKSKVPGIMHACGHDVHTTCLLGAARILYQIKESFGGTLRLIFQPGEERVPGGASILIKEGVLQKPDVQHIIGQHVMPYLPVGQVGFRKGLYMASTDELYITIQGKGGHGAMPHQGKDAVLMAAHVIVALQQVVSRNTQPILPCVLSIGKVEANGATNIIPDMVKLEGTFRTLNETWRKEAHEIIRTLAEGVVKSMGGEAIVTIEKGYPFLVNEPELTQRCQDAAIEYLGEENVKELDIWMAAEDFAWYSHEIPGCFYRLGVRNEAKGITSGVHTSTFNIDEDALKTGAGLMAWLAWKELTT